MFNPEELQIIGSLVLGELQAIKSEEQMGAPVNLDEVDGLITIVNKCGDALDDQYSPITFADVEPLSEDEDPEPNGLSELP